jgi:hypothetical protein
VPTHPMAWAVFLKCSSKAKWKVVPSSKVHLTTYVGRFDELTEKPRLPDKSGVGLAEVQIPNWPEVGSEVPQIPNWPEVGSEVPQIPNRPAGGCEVFRTGVACTWLVVSG